MGIDILTSARDLRANDHATVTIIKFRVTDDDILRRTAGKRTLTTLTTVVVTAALDGDAVVAGIEIAILNEHAVATFRIAAITVGAIIINM